MREVLTRTGLDCLEDLDVCELPLAHTCHEASAALTPVPLAPRMEQLAALVTSLMITASGRPPEVASPAIDVLGWLADNRELIDRGAAGPVIGGGCALRWG